MRDLNKTSGRARCGTRRTAFVAALLLTASLIVGCAESRRPTNVVLIGVDTLRRDHLGCYGYGRATSPAIDDLARTGVRFEHAVAASPWTLPSFATIFTSLHPSQHGASGAMSPMGKGFPTLAGVLAENGYATGAIVNAPFLKRTYGVNRGFEFYDVASPEDRVAEGTTTDALEWIDGQADGPFMLFVHYFDPHLPYSPPPPYDTLFYPDYSGEIPNPYDPTSLALIRDRGFRQMASLSADDWRRLESLYDGEIAFADRWIGELLAGLGRRGLLEHTLVVLVSDHGEEFFEHEGFEHGHTLYEELIGIPLIISLPGTLPENAAIARQVRHVDVMPTILDMLDMEIPAEAEGVSLVPLMARADDEPKKGPEGVARDASEDDPKTASPDVALAESGDDGQAGEGRVRRAGPEKLPPEIAYAEALLYGEEQKSLSAYPWKLIYNTVTDEAELYNLVQDPDERENLQGLGHPSEALLYESLFRLVFSTSDTWYVEMAGGGEAHAYDISIKAMERRGPAALATHKLIDSDGNILSTDALGGADIRPAGIEFRDLMVSAPLVLAFKTEKSRVTVEFDIRIEGEPAVSRTFIGRSMMNPASMPFTVRSAAERVEGRAEAMPDPPYCLIWMERSSFREEATVELDDETRRELRSLGYIQ